MYQKRSPRTHKKLPLIYSWVAYFLGRWWQNQRMLLRQADERQLLVKLMVLKMNPARHLYERLGFRIDDETDIKYSMNYLPGFNILA
jgi:hypothetical protein